MVNKYANDLGTFIQLKMDFDGSKCKNTDCPIKLFEIGFDTDLSQGKTTFQFHMIFMEVKFEFMSVGVVLDTLLDLVPDQVPALRCGNALWILLLS